MASDDIPWLLLERYCAGTCTAEERAALEAWWEGDPRRQLLASRLRELFADRATVPDADDVERAWTRLATTPDVRASGEGRGSAASGTGRRRWTGPVAMVLLVLALVLVLLVLARRLFPSAR